MDKWKSRFCVHGVLLLSAICASLGLHVTIPQTIYEVARGDEVIMTCNFQPKNSVNRLIIISWTGEPDGSFDDEGISFGTFYSDDGHVDIDAMYEGKVQIKSDVNKKSSDLILKQVTLRESRRIKCHVQIPGDTAGRTSDFTSLVVLVAPSVPDCKVKGTAEYGQNISLTCVSEEGSPTPTYQWQSYDVKNMPRSLPPKTTEKDGVLSLFNVSMDTSGYYICTSTNKIHSAKCNLTLSVMPSTMKIGATAGIIGGCIAGVAVLVLIIYCCCKDKQQPEEFAMEPPMEEYRDIPAEGKKDVRKTSIEGHIDQRERYEMKTEKDSDRNSNRRFDDDDEHPADQLPKRHDDQRDIYRDNNGDHRERYDDRKHQYNDQQNNSDDRRGQYDDRRGQYDDRRGQYDDRQYRSDGRGDGFNNQQDRYDDHTDRYDDRRDRYNNAHDRDDDGRGHYHQNRFDDRNSFDDRREDYDDRQGRYDNHRYRYADRQGQYTDRDNR